VRQLAAQVAALAAADPDAHRPADVDQSMNMSTAAPRPSAPSSSSSSSSSASAADSNKLNQRLKEMFKERITSFREAVYLLTGYKVDLYAPDAATGGHARLRLRSMYAEDPDDSLLFQWKGETLELMETPFAGKLNPKLFAYLSSCNSVPAFLANVTLELFDNQTFL
jgi:mitotic spindle assembly checkpoint protein MAD1